MDARAQVGLILAHVDDLSRNAFSARLKTIYAEHASKGLLKSGATVRVAVRAMEELGGEFVTASVNQVSDVAKDIEAFEEITDACAKFLNFLQSQVDDIAAMAAGRADPDRSKSIFNAAAALYAEARTRLERQLEIHRFTFTKPYQAHGAELSRTPDQAPAELIAATIPAGYITLADAYVDLHEAIIVAAQLDEPPALDEASQAEQLESWQRRARIAFAAVECIRRSLTHSTDYPALDVETRQLPGAATERLDWRLLAGSNSLDWTATIKTGKLIVLSDPRLKALDRWPLMLRREAWRHSMPTLLKAAGFGSQTKQRLPEVRLMVWWQSLGDDERAESQNELHARASRAFPEHHVSRQRIRALAAGRRPGRKPIGQNPPA